MNFALDVVAAAPPAQRAMVTIDGAGRRREWTIAEVARGAEAAAARLHALGVRRGDVVLTLLGNQPEWVLAMVACFRQGSVVLPCTEQLRAKDLRLRLAVAEPRAIVADERNGDVLRDAGWDGPVVWPRLRRAPASAPPAAARLGARRPVPDHVHVRDGRRAEGGAARAALPRRPARAGRALARPAAGRPRLVHRRLRLVQVGPQRVHRAVDPRRRGAAPRRALRPARAARRCSSASASTVLCMAPTEYRVIAKRAEPRAAPALRGLVAAGEALDPAVLGAWHDATGLWIRDGYGQTETGQLTGMPLGEPARPGSMGRPLPGVGLDVVDGELVLDPATDPTFFLGYLARRRRRPGRGGPATACTPTTTASSTSRAAPTT